MTETLTETLPYGEWPSPITAKVIAEGASSVGEVVPDGDCLWWSEHRPSEGRTVVMHLCGGGVSEGYVGDGGVGDIAGEDVGGVGEAAVEVTPTDGNVRTRVHEYGGGAWWAEGGVLYYSDDSDGNLRKLAVCGKAGGDSEGGQVAEPTLLTEASQLHADRFADMRLSADSKWLICVRERHGGQQGEKSSEPHDLPRNEIAAVATDGSGKIITLISGSDFYSSPRPSPDGKHLAWLSWNLPDMPWDNTDLWVAELNTANCEIQNPRCLSGKATTGLDEWISQPEWNAKKLTFISDNAASQNHASQNHHSNGWTALWMTEFSQDGTAAPRILLDYPDAEIQTPHWVFGQSRYAHANSGTVWAVTKNGEDELHFGAGVAFSDCSSVSSVQPWKSGVVALIHRWSTTPEILYLQKRGGKVKTQTIRSASGPSFDPDFFPHPEAISFPTGNSATAHALYFAPANPHAQAPPDQKPPLIVLAHGGPTGAARKELAWSRVYWTSRGFAVVDVDYRGSTGYGRQYRNSLYEQWGIYDVEDCIAVAKFLADRGDVDASRLAIIGGSAGGYAVLCALAFHSTFSAGVSRYGVADLEALAQDTHKFECRYLDKLVGPYPEQKQLYIDRSPIHHTDGLDCPMLILQGLQDKIVPPDQAEIMVEALKTRNLPHAYLTFPEEGHGFRNSDSMIAAAEAELSFFGQIFNFTPADTSNPDFKAIEVSHG